MEPSATSEKIILNFRWEGPNSKYGGWQSGGLEVRIVDLLFKDAKTSISVHIPDNLPPNTAQRFSFTCRRYHENECEIGEHKFKPLAKETHPESLRVTVEQIRNLTIKAGFFEESPHKGLAIMDRSGKITREKRVLRSDSEVNLKIPEELEIGEIYTLVVMSNNLSLSARLVKEEKTSTKEDDFQFIKDQTELFHLLCATLLPLMGIKVMEFAMKLTNLSSGSKIIINALPNDQTLGINAIKSEIEKIEKGTLKDLMIKIRASKALWESNPLFNQNKMEKETFKAHFNEISKETFKICFNVIGDEGLTNIMRSNLEAIVQGNISPEVRQLINGLANRFKEICINHVNK